MAAAIGKNVGLYYDSPRNVEVGDYIATPTGRTYLVNWVRIQCKGIHVGRQHIRGTVVDPADVAKGATVHPLRWYRRRKRRRS
jgi:hypothetical protein